MASYRYPGRFIALEGGDGSGKSTLLKSIEAELRKQGLMFHSTREPGGTPVADEIREILLKPGRSLSSLTELFLFEAARAEHVETIIKPKLKQGIHVLCDRFSDSTVAFQGYARNMGVELVHSLNQLATGGLKPDAVIWLKIAPVLAQQRIEARGGEKSRIDSEQTSFHHAVFEAFQKMSQGEPDRFIVLDASKPPEGIFTDLLAHDNWKALFSGGQ